MEHRVDKSAYELFSHGECTGSILPEYRQRVTHWLQVKPLTGDIIKENGSRGVWKVTDWDVPVYIKKYKVDSFLDRLRLLFWKSPAEVEFQVLSRMQVLQIPSAKPVGFCNSMDGSYLITESIEETVTIKQALESALFSSSDRRILLQRLAEMTKYLIDVGLYNRDYHIGNILVKKTAPRELFAIDVQKCTLRNHLPLRWRARMIAFMLLSLETFMSATEMLRFTLHSLGPIAPYYKRKYIQRIIDELNLCREEYRNKHDIRCWQEGSEFQLTKEGDVRGRIRRDSPHEMIQKALQGHREGKNTDVKTLPNRRISVYQGSLYVKEFRRNPLLLFMMRFWGIDYGGRAWEMAHALRVRRIPHPHMYALYETRGTSYIIGEWIEEGKPLNVFCRDHAGRLGRSERNTVLQRIARGLRLMLERGLYHKDLKPNNIIVKKSDGVSEWFLLDLEDVRAHPHRELHRMKSMIIRMLSHLNGGMEPPLRITERYRFCRYFSGRSVILTEQRKRIIRLIAQQTAKRHHLWPK